MKPFSLGKKRIFYYTEDARSVRDQLEGRSFTYTGQPLVFGVSTDTIINGAACTLGYTEPILGPHFLVGKGDVIHEGDVQKGNFSVVVGGESYGSGSSREVAVVAHRGAGIELVIAKSLERIFRENMTFDRLYFTNDMTVMDKLLAGETVDLDVLMEKQLSPLYKSVFFGGGLLEFGKKVIAGKAELPYKAVRRSVKPMTIAEKILARKAVATDAPGGQGLNYSEPGEQLFVKADFLGIHEYTGGHVRSLYEKAFGHNPTDKGVTIRGFNDHFVLIGHDDVPGDVKSKRLASAQALAQELIGFCKEHNLPMHGPGGNLPAGVCHRLVVESYAKPGDVIALTDSHTPTAGVMNCFAYGLGSTAIALGLGTGMIPVTVPKTVRIWIEGEDKLNLVTPKDIILHIIGDPYFREMQWKKEPGDTVIMQFGGPALERFTVDELSVLTNMTVEGSATTGVVEPCTPVIRFLIEKRGMTESDVRSMLVYPDDKATYESVYKVNLADVPVTVATPGDSRNRKPITAVAKTRIDNVVIVSCTGASLEDLKQVAMAIRGHKKLDRIHMVVTPSSQKVYDDAKQLGMIKMFQDFGAVVTKPGCGSCIGNGPGISTKDTITASTSNRNFSGRMGGNGDVFLVSPFVAGVAAVTGELTDPRGWQVVNA
ncbi:MAG TPA: aconitase family protein [bacterium]|nr:aconitase family protein [bacterium]HMZ02949.1 aconitase family protein [bacterium]HNB09736.1 aconitase family protein [bacterium]HNB57435.1 aconitase family protein [bacterium]HNC47825.1 aconitase family protein [bacterium]